MNDKEKQLTMVIRSYLKSSAQRRDTANGDTRSEAFYNGEISAYNNILQRIKHCFYPEQNKRDGHDICGCCLSLTESEYIKHIENIPYCDDCVKGEFEPDLAIENIYKAVDSFLANQTVSK